MVVRENKADDVPTRATVNGSSLPPSDVERYSRQLILPQFGVESQSNLRDGRILVVGVGGLGCPAAMYLAGAGVGTLGLVDRPLDVVEKSNLHRQLAHTEERVNLNKVTSAEITVRALNSSVNVEKHERIEPDNAVGLVARYDVVLDCTDNVMSRYLISDACAAAGVPLVSGSAIGLDGQLTVYCKDETTPCYRCIFPKPPPANCVGSCASAGVLGPVPGVIGTLQALEALKLLGKIRKTTTLARTLLMFDGADTAFRSVKLRPRVDSCHACGDNRTLDVAKFDYEAFANGTPGEKPSSSDSAPVLNPRFRITAEEFAEIRKSSAQYRLIDVRPRTEFDMCHLEEAESYPLGTLASSPVINSNERPPAIRTIFICRRGNASQKAVKLALESKSANVVDVIGGLQSWHFEVDGNFPLY